MSTITKNKEKTINECLQELDEAKIKELFNRIPKELKSKNKRISIKEKIEYIEKYIITIYPLKSLLFTDKEMEEQKDLINGKKISNISNKLLDDYFVFKEDDTYILPKEIKEMYLFCSQEKSQKEKYLLAISFYMEINGVLKIEKLIELLKETGLKLSKKKILEYIKEKDYIIIKDIIYINDLAKCLDKEINLVELKNNNFYKKYTLEEIISTLAFIEEMEFDKKITSLLSKEIKNKTKLEKISNIIFNIIRVGYDYQEQIEELLLNEKITLLKSTEKKLNDLIEDIYWNLPSWILNGYSESELLEDEYDIDDFDNLNKEEKAKAYITTYMMINGVMETKIMLEILEIEHNIKITLAELKKIIEEVDFIAIEGKYIKIDGLETDVIEEIIKYKNILGKYKVIDNVEEILTEFDKIDAEIDKISTKYNLSENTILSIKSIMNLGGIDSKILEIILETEGCNMSPKNQRELLKDLKRILKNLRIWALNGYKKSELTEVNKIEKIGRNTLCPCGSGKKYKHCCGK